MAAASTRTREGDALFFTSLAIGDPVAQACLASGYARRSVYRWRRTDALFARAWDVAVRRALEDEADRRLRDRYERHVTVGGRFVATRNACPDALLFARYDALWRARRVPAVAATALAPTPPAPSQRRGWLARCFAGLPPFFTRTQTTPSHVR